MRLAFPKIGGQSATIVEIESPFPLKMGVSSPNFGIFPFHLILEGELESHPFLIFSGKRNLSTSPHLKPTNARGILEGARRRGRDGEKEKAVRGREKTDGKIYEASLRFFVASDRD